MYTKPVYLILKLFWHVYNWIFFLKSSLNYLYDNKWKPKTSLYIINPKCDWFRVQKNILPNYLYDKNMWFNDCSIECLFYINTWALKYDYLISDAMTLGEVKELMLERGIHGDSTLYKLQKNNKFRFRSVIYRYVHIVENKRGG